VVHATQDPLTHQQQAVATAEPLKLDFKPEHLNVVRNGLVGVTTGGTSAQVFAGAPYTSAGKTGTAQAVTIGQKDKYNAAKLTEHQRDHALYMAFAPADTPRIALAVIVENAGFGAAHAAPIARRVFDYWLQDQYPSEEDIAATQKGQTSRPIGTPRHKNDIALGNTP
jgi:penicillin-binding protein 2